MCVQCRINFGKGFQTTVSKLLCIFWAFYFCSHTSWVPSRQQETLVGERLGLSCGAKKCPQLPAEFESKVCFTRPFFRERRGAQVVIVETAELPFPLHCDVFSNDTVARPVGNGDVSCCTDHCWWRLCWSWLACWWVIFLRWSVI